MLIYRDHIFKIFLIVSMLQLTGEAVHISWLADSNKVLLMPLLAILFKRNNPVEGITATVAAAMLCSWFGDILLLFDESEWFFLSGMLSFFIAHVFFIRVFTVTGLNLNRYLWIKVGLSLFIILISYLCLQAIIPQSGGFGPYLVGYALILVSMGISSILRMGKTRWRSFWLVTSGAMLFILSDTLIAYTKFIKSVHLEGAAIMMTYILAQYLMICGIMAHEKVNKT